MTRPCAALIGERTVSDYNRIRNVPCCPVCLFPKIRGLVICWECSSTLKRQFGGGWGEKTERMLLRVETMLGAAGVEAINGEA